MKFKAKSFILMKSIKNTFLRQLVINIVNALIFQPEEFYIIYKSS